MRNGHKPRERQAVDLFENSNKVPEVEAPQLKSVPPLVVGDADAMQLGFDAFDSVGEPAEVLIRVSTEALAGEEDLVDEGDEIEEPVEPEQAAQVIETVEPEPVEPEPVEPEQAAQVIETVEPEPVEPEPVAPEQAAVEVVETVEAEPVEPAQSQPADDRALQIRLARIHLKTGSFAMARAELEALAARNRLDTPAHLDLAEVRWRTGDIHGAGEAAAAYIADGGDEALGFVIAAEAAATANRHANSRRYVEQALQRHPTELDPVFAGLPSRAAWSSGTWATSAAAEAEISIAGPAASTGQAEPAAVAAIEPAVEPVVVPVEPEVNAREAGIAAREASVAAREANVSAREGTALAEGAVDTAPTPPVIPTVDPAPHPTEAGAEVESGLVYLRADDPMMAALHFAVAIRLAPASASAVLAAIGDRQDLPLQLVRGDALRLLGLEGDAGRAYLSVATALGAPKSAPQKTAAQTPAEPVASDEAAAPSSANPDPESQAELQTKPQPEPEDSDAPPIRWD